MAPAQRKPPIYPDDPRVERLRVRLILGGFLAALPTGFWIDHDEVSLGVAALLFLGWMAAAGDVAFLWLRWRNRR